MHRKSKITVPHLIYKFSIIGDKKGRFVYQFYIVIHQTMYIRQQRVEHVYYHSPCKKNIEKMYDDRKDIGHKYMIAVSNVWVDGTQ